MTNQEYFSLFSEAMKKKKIIRFENSNNRDDYQTYAIRETPEGYVFFCLIETFFKSETDQNTWKTGSLSSFHEFHFVKGAEIDTLLLTDKTYVPRQDYREKLPIMASGESSWETIT